MFWLDDGGAVAHEDPLSSALDDVIRSSTPDGPVDAIVHRLLGRIVDAIVESAAAMTPVATGRRPQLLGAANAPALPVQHLPVLTLGPVPRCQASRLPQEET